MELEEKQLRNTQQGVPKAMHHFLALSVCLWLDQNYFTKIHISNCLAPRVMKFGESMGVDNPKVDLEGQCHKV